MSKILEYADYVVGHFSDYPGGITPMKLQKLLYYLKAWGLVANEPAIAESFAKWKYGPVNQEVYDHYKYYGASKIPTKTSKDTKIDHQKFAQFVLESYAPYSAITLSALTHKEDPWIETEPLKTISDQSIKSFYKNQHFAKNFPLDDHKPYYPVLTDMYYSFIMDMDPEKVKPPVYLSFEYYKQKTANAKADIEKTFASFLKQHHSL